MFLDEDSAKFFFDIQTENDNLIIRYEYAQDPKSECTHVFLKLNTKMKNLELFDTIIMPDPNMRIIKEVDAHDPSHFRYFLLIFDKRFQELKPNSPNTCFSINIVAIGKFSSIASLVSNFFVCFYCRSCVSATR